MTNDPTNILLVICLIALIPMTVSFLKIKTGLLMLFARGRAIKEWQENPKQGDVCCCLHDKHPRSFVIVHIEKLTKHHIKVTAKALDTSEEIIIEKGINQLIPIIALEGCQWKVSNALFGKRDLHEWPRHQDNKIQKS